MRQLFFLLCGLLIAVNLYFSAYLPLHNDLRLSNDIGRDFLLLREIDEKKIIKYGSIAHTLPIPKVFISDNKINTGDEVEIYRTKIEGRDALVLFAKLPEAVSSLSEQTLQN